MDTASSPNSPVDAQASSQPKRSAAWVRRVWCVRVSDRCGSRVGLAATVFDNIGFEVLGDHVIHRQQCDRIELGSDAGNSRITTD